MKLQGCCQRSGAVAAEGETSFSPRGFIRRIRKASGWIAPSVGLALLPKCPVCLAAYLAIGTGLGVSLTTATYLRTLFELLCVASLGYLAARRLRGLIDRFVGNGVGGKALSPGARSLKLEDLKRLSCVARIITWASVTKFGRVRIPGSGWLSARTATPGRLALLPAEFKLPATLAWQSKRWRRG